MTHQVNGNPMERSGLMKKHLIVFKLKKKVFCKEYIWDWTCCLQLVFENYSNENAIDTDEDDSGLEELDKEIDETGEIFDINTFLSLFPCSLKVQFSLSVLPKLKEKVFPKKILLIHLDTISKSIQYFQELYLKLVHWRNTRVNKFLTIATRIVMTPDEIYETYVDFNGYPELDINTYNMLIRKANC